MAALPHALLLRAIRWRFCRITGVLCAQVLLAISRISRRSIVEALINNADKMGLWRHSALFTAVAECVSVRQFAAMVHPILPPLCHWCETPHISAYG